MAVNVAAGNRELVMLVDVLAREKNVPRDIVFGALEMALASATKKKYTEDIDVRVAVDVNTGAYETLRRWRVLPDDAPDWNTAQMLSVEEAQDRGKADAKVDDVIEQPIPNVEFGRIGACRIARHLAVQVDPALVVVARVLLVPLDRQFGDLQRVLAVLALVAGDIRIEPLAELGDHGTRGRVLAPQRVVDRANARHVVPEHGIGHVRVIERHRVGERVQRGRRQPGSGGDRRCAECRPSRDGHGPPTHLDRLCSPHSRDFKP